MIIAVGSSRGVHHAEGRSTQNSCPKNPVAALGVKELKALVHNQKRKCDGAVPTSKKDLVVRYESICCRADQTHNKYMTSIGHQ